MSEVVPRILVFIPAFRCEAQVSRVLQQFDTRVRPWVDTIIVVDNRSPDATVERAIRLGSSCLADLNFIVFKNEQNYGLGGSHKVAFRYAADHGFDFLVVLHGDDQADIHDLIPELEAGSHLAVDWLLGARFMKNSRLKGYSRFRTFGNHVYNYIFSLATSKRVYDLGSGLNVYRVSSLANYNHTTFPDDLTFNYVMLLAGYDSMQRIKFFPISWREEDQVSNVKLFRQAVKVLRLLVGYIFGRNAFLRSEMRDRPVASYDGQIVHRQSAPAK